MKNTLGLIELRLSFELCAAYGRRCGDPCADDGAEQAEDRHRDGMPARTRHQAGGPCKTVTASAECTLLRLKRLSSEKE